MRVSQNGVLLCATLVSMCRALPSASSETGLEMLARSSISLAANSTSSINTNNTADCTNCTNLGNFVNPVPATANDPVVNLQNGSYAGISISPIPASATLSGFGTNRSQEAFLGIPYSRQPTGNLRFARPASLNQSWSETRSAKRYSEHCYGVGTDNDYNPPYVTYKLGEECLTLNVVRPAGTSQSSSLPVMVWIHGGGFGYGGSGDIRYNGSFIVDQSVTLETPIIYTSINYRTSLLGFPTGDEASQEGIENLGLYDQRLALQWIKENIGAFGGDPNKVTIVGESAGGASVLFHLSAFKGRDDQLFRSAVVESGYYATAPLTANTTATRNRLWSSFKNSVGCSANSSGSSSLDCLRSVSLESIKQWSVNNSASIGQFNPTPDGDLVAQDLQKSYLEGQFVKTVPVILNANLDEGLSFGVRGLNTTQQIVAALERSQDFPDGTLTSQAEGSITSVYPDNEDIYPPFQAGAGLLPAQSDRGIGGYMDRRSCAIFGDLLFIGPKRQAAELLARSSASPIYVSRFDQVTFNLTIVAGAPHFIEVASVFRNPLNTQNSLGPKPKDTQLADWMSSYWISFVATQDPNTAQEGGCLGDKVPYWPSYKPDGDRQSIAWVNVPGLNEYPKIIPDNYRREGIKLLLDIRAGTYNAANYQSYGKRDEL